MASIAELEPIEKLEGYPTHEQIATAIRICITSDFDGRRVSIKLSTKSKFRTALVAVCKDADVLMPHVHTVDDVLSSMTGKNWTFSYDKRKTRFILAPIVDS